MPLPPAVQQRLSSPFDRTTLQAEGPVDAAAFDAIQPAVADLCARASLHGQHEVVAALVPVLALAEPASITKAASGA